MNWGSINVVFAPPISAKQYTDDFIANRIDPPRPAPSSPTNNVVMDPYKNEDHRRELLHTLSYSIVSALDKNVVITSTSIVATVLLSYPYRQVIYYCYCLIYYFWLVLTSRRGISREDLVSKCDWLRDEIFARGSEVAFEGSAEGNILLSSFNVFNIKMKTIAMVDYALKLLRNLIQKRRNMYEPTQSVEGQSPSPVPSSNYRKNILVLS